MIFSSQLQFSDAQSVIGTVQTFNSTNVVDTGAPGTVYGAAAALDRNVGKGEEVDIVCQVVTTLASAGAATLQFQIETADNAAFTTNNEVVAQSRAYALAECVAGLTFGVDELPDDMRRFIRVNYVVAGATTTAGAVTSGIVHGVQHN